MAEGNPVKSFYVQLPGYQQGEVWDEEKYNRNKEQLFKDHQDAMVVETSPLAQDEVIKDDGMFAVKLPGYEKGELWDGAKLNRNREQLLKDHPDAVITKTSPVNYWGDKLNDISTRIDALENELKGMPDEERHLGVNISDADALDVITDTPERRRRNQINAELDQLHRERESNPAWQAYWDKTKEELRGSIKQTEEDADISKGVSVKNEKGEYGFRQFGSSMESDYFKTAKQLYKDALKTAEAPSKYDDSLGIVNFAKGAAENIGSAVTMLELAKAMKMTNVIGTVKQIQAAEGENVNLLDLVENQPERLSYLSPGQREMMKAFIKRAEIEQDRSGDMSIGYNAGKGAIQSVGFMADFLLTGGAGSAAGKAVAKKLVKETAEDISAKTLTGAAKKMLVGNLEGATKALVMTPMMPSSYSSFLDNMTQLNSKGGMDLTGKAVLNSVGDALVETFSENAGELFGIPFEGKIFDTLSKSKLGEVGKAMSRTGAGRFLNNAGWHGMVGEMAEEVLGNAIRSATGIDDDALKNFFSKDEFLTTLASFAPMSVIGGASSAYQVRKAGKRMSDSSEALAKILGSYGMEASEIESMLNMDGRETPEELGKAIASIGRAADATGKVEDVASLSKALGEYAIASSRNKVLKGVFENEQDVKRANNAALIDSEVGDNNWYHQGEDGNYVRTITDDEGNESYVISQQDGELALVDRQGNKYFMTESSLANGIESGAITDSGEIPINQYLDGVSEKEQKTAEEVRMTEETNEQIKAIQDRIAADPTINMGTEEAPKMAVVDAVNSNGVHVTWQDEDGAKDATLTWEQVGNYLGTPVETKTDEQIEQEEIQAEEDIRSRKEDYNKTIPEGTEFTAVLVEGEEPVTYQFKRAFLNEDGTMMLQVVDKATGKDEQITEDMALQGNLTSVLDSFKTPAEVQQEEAVTQEETPVDDGILRDFRGNPIPLKDDGSVNQTALWNADPEAWARWNDSQRNDGGENSRGYIAKATKKLQSDAKAVQKQIDSELDFDRISQLEGQLASINSRIADLERIENNYANAEVAQAEAVQTPEEVPAPVAETTEAAPVAEATQTQGDAEAARVQAMKDRVRAWVERTGVEADVFESPDQVENKQAAKAIAEGQPVAGWFEPNTGKVVIYLPNILDEAEIDRTYMHEVISHKGLRDLLGNEGWNTLMDSVWNNIMNEKDKADYLKYNSHLKGTEEFLRRAAADEYVAHLAENVNTENMGAWQKFVEMVKEILLKLGMDVKLTTEDLSNLLQASLANYERMQAEKRAAEQPAVSEEMQRISQRIADILSGKDETNYKNHLDDRVEVPSEATDEMDRQWEEYKQSIEEQKKPIQKQMVDLRERFKQEAAETVDRNIAEKGLPVSETARANAITEEYNNLLDTNEEYQNLGKQLGDLNDLASTKVKENFRHNVIGMLHLEYANEDTVTKEITANLGGQIEGEGGNQPTLFSVKAIAEGAGFQANEEDTEGNVTFTTSDGRVFDGHHPLTVEDVKGEKNSVMNYMMEDARRFGTITPEQEGIIWQRYTDVLNRMLEKGLEENGGYDYLSSQWQWVGETVFKTVSTNSDAQYSYSLDITRVCKKNEAVINSISAMQRKLGYGITPGQVMDIYLSSIEEGYQVPCPVCYVFSRYIANGRYATMAINGQKKYGSQLVDPSTLSEKEKKERIKYWVSELKKQEKKNKDNDKTITKAKDNISHILDQIDKLGNVVLEGKSSEAEKQAAREEIEKLDREYKASLNTVSQSGLTSWIKSFAIHKVKGEWQLYDDTFRGFPEEYALDLRLTADTIRKYPAIQRLRKSIGSAGGKEIHFAANNDIGDVPMMLGASNLKTAQNFYKQAVEAKTPKQKEKALKAATERFADAMVYAQMQSLRGGQRMWSWSDNIERLAPDVFVNLVQLELLGGALQSYSKQLEGVNLVARMGGYVNGSLMAYGIGYQTVAEDATEVVDGREVLREDITDTVTEVTPEGQIQRTRILAQKGSPIFNNNGEKVVLLFDDVVGIDAYGRDVDGKHMKGLFDLNATLDKAGNILVGMDDVHVRAAMADDRVFFIIPWHSSGQSVHILSQMLGFLGVDIRKFKPRDYTNVQEEKEATGKEGKVNPYLIEFWEAHKNETDYACGIEGGIPSGKDGKLSKEQKEYRALRDAIFTDKNLVNDKKRMKIINSDVFLKQVWDKVHNTVSSGMMTKGDTKYIYPYEYWDQKSTYDTADVNGARYLEYCRRMGVKPKFVGKLDGNPEKDFGNFANDKGYWKLLIDRRMYRVNGTFQDLDPVTADGFTPDLIDPKKTEKEFIVTRVADSEGVERIADQAIKREENRPGGLASVNYDMTLEQAVKEQEKVTEPKLSKALRKKLTKAQQNVLNFIDTGEFASEVKGIEGANATQKQPVSWNRDLGRWVVTEEDVMDVPMFRLSKNNKATVESWLKKREDINDEQRAEVVDYIDKLDDAKTQLATAKWFANGTIRIPEDMKKVQQAISVAGKAKVDPLRYNSPMELLDAHADFKPSEERINPDEVSTLHRAAEYPEGIVVYDVDNTKESRENMRKIINTHFGEDASPWCLLQGDGKGNLTESSAKYWKHYNAYPKQVAFKDGKLLAFSANDTHTRVWWDRQDQSHYGIPLTKKVEGDELGRSADYIVDGGGKLIIEPGGHMYRGNRQNGVYEEWNSDGSQLLSRIEYKDGKEDGISEEWYPSGQIRKRAVMKEDRYAGTYEQWYDNGQQKVKGELNEEGDWDGEQVGWYRNGNKSHEWRAKEGKTVGDHIQYYETGEPKFIQHFDEEGTLAGYEDYVSWRAEKGIKAHIGIGRRVTYAPGDSNRRTEEEFRANGKLHKREEYHGSKLDGIVEYYYPDGTIQTRTHYVEGTRHGLKEVYHENGRLWLRGDFKDGEVDGIQEQWNKEGDLILREEWKDGEKVRTLPLDENVQFRKVEPIVDGKSEELFEQAKKTFGTTNNLSEAGYVIPDGSMLDFSGRHLLDPGQDSSWMNGMRQVDHREISDINYEKDGNTPSGYETDMRDFIRRGAIRLNSGVINLATKPTKGQENVLWGLIQRANGDVDVDFGDGYDSDHYASYNHARPERILNDIRRYFDEGIEPEGNVMFRKANQTQNGFISNAQMALDKIKMDKATPEQWVKMLEKEGGLKAGEDKWLGLSDWLKASDKKTLTKDEIADYIEQNRIQIDEVRYTEDGDLAARELNERYPGFNHAFFIEEDAFRGNAYIDGLNDIQAAIDLYNREHEDKIEWGDYLTDEKERKLIEFGQELLDKGNKESRPINQTRLDYTTPGLDNKREIALTVPTIDPWNESDKIHFGDAGEGRAVAWIRFGDTNMNSEETKAVDSYLAEMREKYGAVPGEETDHMTEDEIAHLQSLTSSEMDATKPRVLVIDEIQSNRHQEGREKGYNTPYREAKKELDENRRKQQDLMSSEDFRFLSGFGLIKEDSSELIETPDWVSSLPEETQEKIKEVSSRYMEWVEEVRKEPSLRAKVNETEVYKKGVPAAPFEKNWHELAMKRMLRLAAEEGYDKIAWTTGDQQAERYGLGRVIEKIDVDEWDQDTNTKSIELYPRTTDGDTITAVIDKQGTVVSSTLPDLEGKPLSEVVGKGLAEKIIEADEYTDFDADNMRVGGEGMRGFYDDILPRFMNKYGKKWGVKVQDIELPEVYDEIGHPLVMHSVDVTPEMKESVMEGQVMFSLRGIIGAENAEDEVALDNLEVAEEMENAGKDSPTIWRATGWERGADGKWRNEIPDAKLKEGVSLEEYNTAQDVIDAPDLFKSYPDLLFTTIQIKKIKGTVAGSFAPKDNRITIDSSDTKKVDGKTVLTDEGLKTLVHEFQHAIQHIEGFAKGGSGKTVERNYYKGSMKSHPEETLFAWLISRYQNSMVIMMLGKQRIINAMEKYDDSNLNNSEKKVFSNILDRLRGMDETQFRSFVLDASQIAKKAKSAGKEGYYKLAGEVESRNVELRSKLSEEGRRNTAPSLTAEVEEANQIVMFRKRTKEDPKETIKVYKLMRLEDGKKLPLFIDRNSEPLEDGQWYDADSPDLAFLKDMPSGIFLVDANNGTYISLKDYQKERGAKATKWPTVEDVNEASSKGLRWMKITDTEKGQKRYEGENRKYENIGINGSEGVSTFAMRPGWHAGSLPTMRQIGKGSEKNIRDDRFVWVEGEIPADIDYNEEAQRNPDKDIPTHIPTDGYYLKATNADKAKSQADRVGWYVAGSFKPNRVIGDLEARQIIDDWNAEHPDAKVEYDWPREGGRVFNADTMQLEEAPAKEDVLFRRSQDLFNESREGGLTRVIGDENATELYHNVYRAIPKEIRERIVNKAGDGFLFSEATRDAIAEAVENGDPTGLAGLASNMLRDYVGPLDERTARYILWRGDRKAEDDDLLDTVKDITMQRRLQVGEFAEQPMFRKSHITPEQDAEYLNAVEAGDIETAQRLVNEAAKLAMPDTKVVDGDGNPLIVYHGTQHSDKTPDFFIFNLERRMNGRTFGEGFYFTDSKEVGEKWARRFTARGWSGSDEYEKLTPRLIPAFLNITNLVDVTTDGLKTYRDLEYKIKEGRREMRNNGIEEEGTVIRNLKDGYDVPSDVYIARKPNLIKSAEPITYDDNGGVIPLSERFNEDSEDIRFRLGEDIEEAENRAESMADDAQQTKDEKKEFAKVNDALTTIKAMSLQKEYDRKTVNTITALAKNVLKDQSIETLSRHEIARLLGIITTSIGKAPKTVKKNADALVGLIVDHLLRSEETKLGMLAKIKATKIDKGVEKQAALDVRGQNILKAYKKGLTMDLSSKNEEDPTIESSMADAQDRMESKDEAIRAEAEAEYEGLALAKEYKENINNSKNAEDGIDNELKNAAEQLRDGKISRTAYNQFVEEANRAIRENRIKRIEAYQELRQKIGDIISGSKSAAALFREEEKKRIEDIHHLANSDMQGLSFDENQKPESEVWNGGILGFVTSPLRTMVQMMKLFGMKSVDGMGYLYNKFVRGFADARNEEINGYRESIKELDNKVSEVFDEDMKWSDLYRKEEKMPKVKVKWWSGGEKKEFELNQGKMLYIYMVNKMSDGRMKLRRMGITQEDVERITREIDPRLIEIADWLQDEFLVNKRNKYNKIHKRLFGASMASIEDYFPLVVNKRSLNKTEEVGVPQIDALPSTTTGAIIKRTLNANPLDLLNADAFYIAQKHVEQMEHWAAFAELNRDFKTLLSYKRFRNQVQNMNTIYGTGPKLWERLKDTIDLAVGAYSPKGGETTAISTFGKGFTAAKITFRINTALKQLLSMPAFLADASPKYFAENLAAPWKAWKWSMENLPMLQERWKSRFAGDTRLMDTESDWRFFQTRTYEWLSKYGMAPNAFVDALACSIGAHAIYQTKHDKYIKDGYSEEIADQRAKQDAEILYNETQQSNEGAFVSALQKDRDLSSVAFSVYRNSSMGYQRKLHEAIRNFGRRMKPGFKVASTEFMKKQMMRDGLTEEQAEHAAERRYQNQLWHDAVQIGVFGFMLQFMWHLADSMWYLLFGDDDDKKKAMWEETFRNSLSSPVEGLAGGQIISEVVSMIANGDAKNLRNYDPSLLPIIADLKRAVNMYSYDKVAFANEMVNLAAQAITGANLQTLTDTVVAVIDACGGDMETSREAMLLIMRVLQVPQSQIDQIYIDELGVNADKARSMSYSEMAERYARYKMNKNTPLTGWAYSDEAEEKREKAYLKKFKTMVKERKEINKPKDKKR